jgi:hypothetical protein
MRDVSLWTGLSRLASALFDTPVSRLSSLAFVRGRCVGSKRRFTWPMAQSAAPGQNLTCLKRRRVLVRESNHFELTNEHDHLGLSTSSNRAGVLGMRSRCE